MSNFDMFFLWMLFATLFAFINWARLYVAHQRYNHPVESCIHQFVCYVLMAFLPGFCIFAAIVTTYDCISYVLKSLSYKIFNAPVPKEFHEKFCNSIIF